MLYNMCHVMLYNICHVMLCFITCVMCHVMLCYITYVMLYNICMSSFNICYITYVKRLSLIVRVSLVLNRTVVVDSD